MVEPGRAAPLALSSHRAARKPETVISAYRSAREARGEATDAAALFAAIETDPVFRIPAIRLGETLAARDQQSFQYLFTWESPWEDP